MLNNATKNLGLFLLINVKIVTKLMVVEDIPYTLNL